MNKKQDYLVKYGMKDVDSKQMGSVRLGNWGSLSGKKHLFNQYNSIALQQTQFKTSRDNVINEILMDPNQDQKWPLIALMPQISKCRDGIVDQQPIRCQCSFVAETEAQTENMPYCMQQKMSFTASLMSIRIFCSLIDQNENNSNNDKFKKSNDNIKVGFDDVQTISIQVVSFLHKCKDFVDELAENENNSVKQDLLNFCQDFLTQCKDYNFSPINSDNENNEKPFKIEAECNLDLKTADGMLKKVQTINKIESIKNYLHYSAQGCKLVCVITTLAFPPASVVTGPLVLGLTIADAALVKASETAIRRIKGKPVKFSEEDLAKLCQITIDLLSSGLFSTVDVVLDVAKVTLTAGTYSQGAYKGVKSTINTSKKNTKLLIENWLNAFMSNEKHQIIDQKFEFFRHDIVETVSVSIQKSIRILNDKEYLSNSSKQIKVDDKFKMYVGADKDGSIKDGKTGGMLGVMNELLNTTSVDPKRDGMSEHTTQSTQKIYQYKKVLDERKLHQIKTDKIDKTIENIKFNIKVHSTGGQQLLIRQILNGKKLNVYQFYDDMIQDLRQNRAKDDQDDITHLDFLLRHNTIDELFNYDQKINKFKILKEFPPPIDEEIINKLENLENDKEFVQYYQYSSFEIFNIIDLIRSLWNNESQIKLDERNSQSNQINEILQSYIKNQKTGYYFSKFLLEDTIWMIENNKFTNIFEINENKIVNCIDCDHIKDQEKILNIDKRFFDFT